MIELEKFTYEELVALNRAIVTRLKYLRAMRDLHSMSNMHLGQRVCFESRMGMVTGTVVKFNQKTVIVHTDDHQNWKVSPNLLRPLLDQNDSDFQIIEG